MSVYSFICSLIFTLLLFVSSGVLSACGDKTRAGWGFACVVIWLVVFLVVFIPRLSRAREKPVIYLYPTMEQRVNVKLQYDGRLLHSYPEYSDEGWQVIGKPSGELTNVRTGRQHYCLFWEGVDKHEYRLGEGFVVAGKDTAAFLESALATLGLSEREANEFIVHWLPRMERNPFNAISFPTEEYCRHVRLDISPVPDTVIRVFMVFRALNHSVEMKSQKFGPVKRHGFTVVEWGGTELE